MSDELLPRERHKTLQVRRARSRMRRFFLRHVPLTLGGLIVLLALAIVELYLYASSAGFQNVVRERLAASLSSLTGGRVEIASFHWRLLSLEADAGGVVIHGREAAGEAPYAKIDHLHAEVSVLGLLSPRIRLNDLEIERPAIHLIVYADGSTNQPQPRRRRRPGKPVMDRLFDLKAGHIAIDQGVFDYDNRAARFDFQNRYAPLNFAADDLAVRMYYVPASLAAAASYRLETGATDLQLARGAGGQRERAVRGRLETTLDVTRTAAYLRRLRLSSRGADGLERSLEISGTLQDFSHPRWQAKIGGELDMRLLEPLTGFPYAPEGIARLDLTAAGEDGGFGIDGPVHIDGGAYVGTGVVARDVTLDARVHADAYRLLITGIAARLRQGGVIEGTVDLTHWLPPSPNEPRLEPAALEIVRHPSRHASQKSGANPGQGPVTMFAAPLTIPVNGKVTAEFRNVALDTLLGMVSEPPFQKLGIDALLNGPSQAAWTNGDAATVVVSADLALNPSGRRIAGEAPANGTVDATYTQRDGSVDLRKLELQMPESSLAASGKLGAYPMTGATSLAVSFHARRLDEYDAVLRSLGLERDGRSGVAALPARLGGQADFSGTWTGSLLRPHLEGSVKATQLSVELPKARRGAGQPRFVEFDAAQATGSYAEGRIAIQRAVLQQGAARVTVSGTLNAAADRLADGFSGQQNGAVQQNSLLSSQPRVQAAFNRESVLHARVQAEGVSVDQLRPVLERGLPATGTLNTQFTVSGALGAPDGAGWVELAGGSLFGEPVARARAQGSVVGKVLELSAVSVSLAGGSVTGTGSYDFAARRFQAAAKGERIELARLEAARRRGIALTGNLGIAVTGTGTLDDPRLEGRATVNGFVVAGETLGALDIQAHTAASTLHYGVKTLLAGAALNLQGQTELRGDYATENRLEFSGFDVGALLKLAQVKDISGKSALSGTVNLAGPLAAPEQLRGEASLKTLAVTLAGVHLEGQGGAHATLAGGRIHLDPVHVTGEDTDLHVLGTVALTEPRQMDLAASGTINLKLAETLDPDLTASGTTTFEVEAHGTTRNPGLRGRIDVQNGSLSLGDLPNGLSQVKGTLVFNQNRLEVRQLTGMTGGGLLSFGGSLTDQQGLHADLTVTGKGVRIRYPQGVSSLADANLRLQGPATNLLLSGNVMITRFATSPDLDLTALAAQANAQVESVALPNAPSNHVRLDVHLESSPQLNFQNAFAKLAGDVDLRLRGTLASPSVLGRVSITEGSAVIAGTRYELERGDVTLTNPVRIEPIIDLTATAHVEDYDITLGLHGTPQKLAVTYRSDPPLPESDVVSLLALGHTEDQERLYTRQQEQEFANPTTDALLGGALNATVSSRVQKLFGAGSVKVDPDYLGAFGNSTSRITVQEQLGRNLVLTYATDVNTTSQQLLQAEVAINRHVSLVVARDESGVFSMVLKATRRYR